MRRLFTILVAVLLTASVWAQSPQKMSYQAVIRNSNNALVTNTQVGMQISILQGSASGTAVYNETQTPTTNTNGLVSIEIGGGAGFSIIDWAAGPYFIKTETDPTGGTNYIITGTSQLLNVPYALYAKTTESISGGITEVDPLWIASPSYGITNTNITNWNTALGWGNHATAGYLTSFTETDPIFTIHPANGISATNITDWNTAYGWGNHAGLYRPISWVPSWADVTGKPTFATVATSGSYNDLSDKPVTDGSETKITGGSNFIVTGSGTTANPYVVNTTGTTLTIGQSYQGGIIFWVDATGEHGLIAATTDQSTGIQWYNDNYWYTNATGDQLYAGKINTTKIIAKQMRDNQYGNFAAKVCADYSVTFGGVTYGDWYLPSEFELHLLYLQKTVVGGFADAIYWSSTEDSSLGAWYHNFGYWPSQYFYDKFSTLHVRAIRAF